MGRYTALFITAFTLLVIAFGSSMYLSKHVSEVKTVSTLPAITVLTTLPAENVAPLADEYEKNHKIKVVFVPLTEDELAKRVTDTGKADLVLTNSHMLNRIAGNGWLVPHISETGDSVWDGLKDQNGFWTGVWYDPVVFCINYDYAVRQESLPMSWQELADRKDIRIGMTDFLAADASANILFTMISQYGEENTTKIFTKLHPKVVQYSKYLSTPVRMAGMGEVDVSIAVQSEALRYINEEFPLTIAYPSEGTACTLTGTGILLKSPNEEQAKLFADWLQGDEAQLVLQKNNFYFMPTNRNTMAYKKMTGKNLVLFMPLVDLPKERKQELLDKWVKNTRLN